MNKPLKLVATIGDDSWYWAESLSIVVRVNNLGAKAFVMRKANTEVNAVRMVCHRYLGATSE